MPLREWDRVRIVVCPVADKRESFGKIARYIDSSASAVFSKISPFEHFEKAASLLHWAVQVRNVVYDVSGFNAGGDGQKDLAATRVYGSNNVKDWEHMREKNGMPFRRLLVGVTYHPDHIIEAKAERIWKSRFEEKYRLHRSNCQNFVCCLLLSICDTDMFQYKQMPTPITMIKTKLLVASGGVAGVVGLYQLSNFLSVIAEAIGTDGFDEKVEEIGIGLVVVMISLATSRKSRDERWMDRERKIEKLRQLRRWVFGDSMNDLRLDVGNDIYGGYNVESVDWFTQRGFAIQDVVLVLQRFGIPTYKGYYFRLPENDCRTIFDLLRGETDVYDEYSEDSW